LVAASARAEIIFFAQAFDDEDDAGTSVADQIL